MALSPRESAALISKLAKDVTIDKFGIKKAAAIVEANMKQKRYDIKNWKNHKLHPKTKDVAAIDWIFLVDTLNFSFWSEKGKEYTVRYKDEEYSGYWALCAAVNRALEEEQPITSPEYYSSVSFETLKHIFRSESGTEIPLLKERHEILNDTGTRLLNIFGGSFVHVVSLSNHSAMKLLELVVENFPSFRDEAIIEDQKVSLYKRAQILIADIWACFEAEDLGKFVDINELTMFADYRIPQVLLFFGALKYSPDLWKRLKENSVFENGERLEVEIRGCSIQAVEEIVEKLQDHKEMICGVTYHVNAVLLDYFLWDYRQRYAKGLEQIPFHKTRCIFY